MQTHIARSKQRKYFTRTHGNLKVIKTIPTEQPTSHHVKEKHMPLNTNRNYWQKYRMFGFICVLSVFFLSTFTNIQSISPSISLVDDFHTIAFHCICILLMNEINSTVLLWKWLSFGATVYRCGGARAIQSYHIHQLMTHTTSI